MPSIAIPNSPSPPPSPPALDQNLPCLRCGYNLRTLSTDARCPECATPIASSLNTNLIRYADPSWTGVLALAMGLMLVSASIELVVTVCILLAERSESLVISMVFSPPVESIHSFTNPLFWLSVFLLGRPDSHPPLVERRFSIRRIMRFTAVFALISAIIADSSGLDTSQILPDYLSEFPFAHVIELFATILLYLYLLQLARRTGLPPLLRRTRIAMAAMIFALCTWTLLDLNSEQEWSEKYDFFARLLLMPIFVYQLYVLFLFHRTLRKCASFARQHWNFCSPLPQPNPIT